MILVLACLVVPTVPAGASEAGLTGLEGHPRSQFPLRLWMQPSGDALLDAAARRAVEDWNAVTRDVLGLEAFAVGSPREAAQVRVSLEPRATQGLMGVTHLRTDTAGVIELPVTIVLVEPAARGQTSRETVLYQVLAHELGHALGLPHVRDPRSLMCCERGTVDLGDPATREAYVEARRRPDVGTVRAQLAEQYARVWRR